MTLPLSLLNLRRRGGFGPASLFAAGEAGFWGEVNPSTLWQDVARTLPVTAAGQSVQSWMLRTAAGGVIYATQAATGNAPQYQIDGNGRGFLLFDGIDDWLQTPAINFSATDEVTVIAGVRKLSDAARAMLVEITSGGAQTFRLEAPSGAGLQQYNYYSRGSLVPSPDSASFLGVAAPVTSVVSGQSKIATDTLTIRVNGVAGTSSTGDQGTGNYANDIVFIGRRAGTTLPFNGRIYSLIVRGALTSGVTLTNAEAWSNARTGAF